MKSIRILLAGALLVLSLSLGMAQDYVVTPVQISKEKVRLNGKAYYSHPVLERQTVYSICKAYGVTEDALYAANPDLLDTGLQTGKTILIPIAQDQAPSVIEHTVMWYEDLDDIAAEYGVSPEDIMAANGMKTRKVTKRQVLRIPVKGTTAKPAAKPAEKAAEKPAEKHAQKATEKPVEKPAEKAAEKPNEKPAEKPTEKTVAPPEIPTLADPVITDPEMAQAGTYRPLEVGKLNVEKAQRLEKETEKEQETEEQIDESALFNWFSGKGTVSMSLVLPFNASGKTGESYMDFYSGVLMALRDLEAAGTKATLDVYDLGAGIPSAIDLAKSDFILGPVTTGDLTSILERAGGRIPVISPLDQRAAQLADTQQRFIQAPATATSQYKDLAEWAASDMAPGDRLIFITEKVSPSTAAAVGVRSALLDSGASYEGLTWTQSEGRNLPASLSNRVSKGGVNRILLASENESFVADVIRNLGILMGRGYQIVVYAPSRVRTFDSVDSAAYHQCHLHISTAYFVDYDNPKVKAFIRAYRALFRTEPSQFAFQGYDITRYFGNMSAQYGNRWPMVLDRAEGIGLHTDFRFEPTQGGSYRNTGVRRIVYNSDYTTELVR